MPELLVVQNIKNSKVNYRVGSEYTLSYGLAKPLEYKEDHFARLVSLSGAKEVVLVFADFLRRQQVNGQLEPYLGTSAANSRNSWVPLANNSVPAIGLMRIKTANTKHFSAGSNITVVIEIASLSWINGAQSETQL